MGWKHYQTFDPQKESPWLVGDCLVKIYTFLLQIPISQIHQIFNISYLPQFDLSFEKKYISFQKYLKIIQKSTQNRKTLVNEISRGIWRCSKRERDIGRKAILNDVKTAFTFTPALSTRI